MTVITGQYSQQIYAFCFCTLYYFPSPPALTSGHHTVT